MTRPVTVSVFGKPAPQGSKRAVVTGGKARVIESSADVMPWRNAVVQAFRSRIGRNPFYGDWHPLEGPVYVECEFYMQRPQAIKNARYCAKRPDLDKLTRSTLDALTDAGAFVDDSQVAELHARKVYTGIETRGSIGALITLESLT